MNVRFNENQAFGFSSLLKWYVYIVEVSQLNQLFINNEFIASKSTDTMDVINPATGEKIDTITFATEAEVNDAVEKSKQAQLEWEKNTRAYTR